MSGFKKVPSPPSIFFTDNKKTGFISHYFWKKFHRYINLLPVNTKHVFLVSSLLKIDQEKMNLHFLTIYVLHAFPPHDGGLDMMFKFGNSLYVNMYFNLNNK